MGMYLLLEQSIALETMDRLSGKWIEVLKTDTLTGLCREACINACFCFTCSENKKHFSP